MKKGRFIQLHEIKKNSSELVIENINNTKGLLCIHKIYAYSNEFLYVSVENKLFSEEL